MAESCEKQGGYECDFVEPPSKELECSICLNILREPNLNDCCGQHFCQACIQRIIDDSKPCPLCNESNFTVILDKKTQRKILELQVRCRWYRSGCEWVGDLKSLDEHCNSCEYMAVDCRNSCGEKIQRRLLTLHLESECPKRHFICAYCGHESTHEAVTIEHWSTCERFPIACKNSCGAQDIPRCEEETHRLEECSLQEVKCKYEYVGCEVKLQRKEVDTHMDTQTKEHLELMENYAEKQKHEKETSEEAMDQLFISADERLTSATNLLRRNCVYIVEASFNRAWNSYHRSGVMYPLYGPGYRMQLGVGNGEYRGDCNQLAVDVIVLGGHSDCRFTWPLKAIVTVELVDRSGRLEPISQSKMGVWQKPSCYNETTRVAFFPFVSRSLSERYMYYDWICRTKDLIFKIYLCQPEQHPDSIRKIN